ncbi:MAG TPA: thaumatin family protein [Polyangiaceae bacterium]
MRAFLAVSFAVVSVAFAACSSSSDDSNGTTPTGCDAGDTRCAELDGGGPGPGSDGSVSGDGSITTPDGGVTGDGGVVDPLACDPTPKAGDRLVSVVNRCVGQTVVVGVNGGFVEDCGAGNTCKPGATCNTTRKPAGCFWDFPAPKCGKPVLAPGDVVTYELTNAPQQVGAVNIKWSGNLYAQTGCDASGKNCKTAQCATSVAGMTVVGACPDGVGPQGPTTLAEFTFAPNGSDFYDVSAINGVNVPVSMQAIGGAAASGDPYSCQTAGGTTATSTGLQGCTWHFDPNVNVNGGAAVDETTTLRAVTAGGATCTSDGDCSGGSKCGTAVDFTTQNLKKSCGTPIGWWTADELCVASNGAAGGQVACNTSVSGQGKNADLYGCNGANPGSCYQNDATATCCGCPDWKVGGTSLALAPGYACHSTNPKWTQVAEPWAAFAKDACPTAYSFPFDDPTSTFTCATAGTNGSTPNSTHYVITFCPDGKDGL